MLPSGSERRALMSLRALLRHNGEVSGAITCVLDVTDSARARQELEHRATFDPLTGCHNRSSILARAGGASSRARSRPATGAVYVDLDRFKPVNDSARTRRRRRAARARRRAPAPREPGQRRRSAASAATSSWSCSRDAPGAEVAMAVAARICRSLCAPFELSAGSVQLSASAGVACSRGEAVSAEDLVRLADAAMYESKQQQRGLPVLAGAAPQLRI